MNLTSALLFAAIGGLTANAAQSVVPEPLPASRYEKMIEGSPFALATRTEAPVEKGPGPFANLYVAAIMQQRDAEGKVQDVVTIKSRADQSTFTLIGNEANKEGIQVVSIDWSDKVGASKVTLKKGTEFGTVSFDEANLHAPPQTPNVPRPGQPPGSIPVPAVPGGNQFRSGNRPPVVPRPTTVAPVPNMPVQQPTGAPANIGQGVPAPGQQNANDRPRRVRVINSKP